MKLARYNYPNMINEMERWLPDPFSGLGELSRFFEGFGNGRSTNRLATDLYEDDDHFYARFELPGVKKDELKVEAEDGVLSVMFHRQQEGERRSESSEYRRSIRLPESVDPAKITAKLEDGLLTVTIAKAEERKPRSIAIN
ncbi:Hsp20/alpha crystallin family protein [soil metagenome]